MKENSRKTKLKAFFLFHLLIIYANDMDLLIYQELFQTMLQELDPKTKQSFFKMFRTSKETRRKTGLPISSTMKRSHNRQTSSIPIPPAFSSLSSPAQIFLPISPKFPSNAYDSILLTKEWKLRYQEEWIQSYWEYLQIRLQRSNYDSHPSADLLQKVKKLYIYM
jgi:hypothetical protein